MTAIGLLQHGALLQRLPIGVLRNGAGAGQTLQDALDVRTRAFGDKARIIKARTVLFQILVEVGDRLVERDGEAGFAVELRLFAHVDIDQRDARIGKPLQRVLADLAEFRIEIFPEMPARYADALTLQ